MREFRLFLCLRAESNRVSSQFLDFTALAQNASHEQTAGWSRLHHSQCASRNEHHRSLGGNCCKYDHGHQDFHCLKGISNPWLIRRCDKADLDPVFLLRWRNTYPYRNNEQYVFPIMSVWTVLTSTVFLVISECSVFKSWYQTNWPVLSNSHSFNFLGLAMVVLGINILGNLNKEATSQKSLGLPFWRVVIGSGIIVFTMGWINILAVCDDRNTVIFSQTNTCTVHHLLW